MTVVVVVLAVIAVALLAVGGVVGGLALLARSRQQKANQVVPGIDSPAPRSWAGSHDPEARLHRRARQAVVALRAVPGLDGAAGAGRADVERYALAVDARLVAVAALPPNVRPEPLARVTADVEGLEAAVADLVSQVAGNERGLEVAMRELSERVASLEAARAEVDAIESGAGDLTRLPPAAPGGPAGGTAIPRTPRTDRQP